MKGMLLTFVLSLIPTWTWLHSENQCGPYIEERTPHDYLNKVLIGMGNTMETFITYASYPTVSWSLLWLSIVVAIYNHEMYSLSRRKLKAVSSVHQLEYQDKSQLLRVEGCIY